MKFDIKKQINKVYKKDFVTRYLINQFFQSVFLEEDKVLEILFDLLFELESELYFSEEIEDYEYCNKVKYVLDRVVEEFDSLYIDREDRIVFKIQTAATAQKTMRDLIRSYDYEYFDADIYE